MKRNFTTSGTPRAGRRRSSASAAAAKIIVSRRRVARRVAELAADIDSRYRGRELTLVVVLTGAVVFAADLVRRLKTPLRLVTVEASSYAGKRTRSRGLVMCGPMPGGLAGRNVLVLDDILDSGLTLKTVVSRLLRRRPLSLRTCVLLRKQRCDGRCDFAADVVGFDVPDRFVVGYGLDYDNRFRDLPDICMLDVPAAGKDRL